MHLSLIKNLTKTHCYKNPLMEYLMLWMKYQIALVRAAGAGAAKRSIRPSISKFITRIQYRKGHSTIHYAAAFIN